MANPHCNPSKSVVGELQIFSSNLFFGASMIGQRLAMLNGIGPISFNAYRYGISVILLTAYVFSLHVSSIRWNLQSKIELLHWGLIGGILHFGASLTQQIGLQSVTAGKTGFITGMYVVFVPIAEHFIPGLGNNDEPLPSSAWMSAIASLVGLYFLSGCAEAEVCFGGAIGMGEGIVFMGMIFCAGTIIATDLGSKRVDIVHMTYIEFILTFFLTAVLALLGGSQTSWAYAERCITTNLVAIIAVGFTEVVGFTVGNIGQEHTSASRAALIYSLEAVTCSVFGYLVLNEKLTNLEVLGCLIMTLSAMASSLLVPMQLQGGGLLLHSSTEDAIDELIADSDDYLTKKDELSQLVGSSCTTTLGYGASQTSGSGRTSILS